MRCRRSSSSAAGERPPVSRVPTTCRARGRTCCSAGRAARRRRRSTCRCWATSPASRSRRSPAPTGSSACAATWSRRHGLGRHARPLLSRLRHAPGLVCEAGDAFLLDLPPEAAGHPYLLEGERLGLPGALQVLDPRAVVEGARSSPAGDLLLSKRSHRMPRLVVNAAGVVTTDTIYRGRSAAGVDPRDLAAVLSLDADAAERRARRAQLRRRSARARAERGRTPAGCVPAAEPRPTCRGCTRSGERGRATRSSPRPTRARADPDAARAAAQRARAARGAAHARAPAQARGSAARRSSQPRSRSQPSSGRCARKDRVEVLVVALVEPGGHPQERERDDVGDARASSPKRKSRSCRSASK